jgi:hypothetical protein
MRPFVGLLIALALLLAAPASLFGQVAAPATRADRPELDYFLSRYHGVDGAGEIEAVGARLMWSLAPLRRQSALLDRTSVGGFLVHSPDENGFTASWRYGAQADLRVTRLPVAGRLDPFLSLGVGASRLLDSEAPESGARVIVAPRTHLSVAPGVGLRYRLAPGFGLRGDARQVLDFREGMQRNVELSGGLSFGV